MNANQLISATLLSMLPMAASAQDQHEAMNHAQAAELPLEVGQGAFGAIAEIVGILGSDPETDWDSVDIEALRQHLIDMDNVTLRSTVSDQLRPGGATFRVSSSDPVVIASIQRMVVAHAATMDGIEGWKMVANPTDAGADLTVTGDELRIRALGFIGVMTLGMHHQAHHLAVAKGFYPHG